MENNKTESTNQNPDASMWGMQGGFDLFGSPLMDELVRLCELDIDAVNLYQMACDRLEDNEYKSAIFRFGVDHERHVVDLTYVILGFGGQPPKLEEGFSDFKTPGVASLEGLDSDHAILKAMVANEVLTNQIYDGLLSSHLLTETDEALRLMIESHKDDERRHLEYIQDIVLILDRGGKVSVSEQAKPGADFIDLEPDQEQPTQTH